MSKLSLTPAIAGFLLSFATLTAPCRATLTGDPLTDGWTFLGNSATTNFNNESGGAVYSADIYTTLFSLDPTSALYTATQGNGANTWTSGDTIVGVGGVFTATGNSTLTYTGPGGATSTRIVVKYGSPSATWTTNSSNPLLPGYGSLAHGGVGSVLLGTFANTFSPANSGTYVVPTDSPELQNTAITNIPVDDLVGREVTDWTGNSLTGFEAFLDLTLLDSQVPTSDVVPGDLFVLDLQNGTLAYQDSQGQLPAISTPPSVPDQGGTLILLAIAAGLLVISQRRVAKAAGL